MSEDSGYRPYFTRRGRGNALTHFLMLVLGAGLAVVLLLAFGQEVSFRSAIIATGSFPVRPPIPGAGLRSLRRF